MKKQLFLASALALVTLASCGGGKGGIKVGLICLHDKNSTYDANFIQAFESACEDAKKAGKISDYSYVTDVAEDDACYTAAERFVNQGYSIIFSDSYGHDPFMRQAAEKYPNVFFSSATGDLARYAGFPNYHNAFASIYEGRYLAGVAAGTYLKDHESAVGKTPLVGYVGAFNYAEVISGFTSWYLGVKSVVPGVRMRVEYTGSWYDYNKEYSTAEKLIKEDKCVLISQHADSMGAPNACKINNIPNVSYNINTVDMDSTCKDTYIAHSRINWKPYYAEVLNTAVGSIIKGETYQNWTGTLGTASVEYHVTDNTNLISAEGKKTIENAEKALKEGAHVFDTSNFTCNNLDPKPESLELDGEGHIESYKVDINGYKDPKGLHDIKDIVATDKTGTYINESYHRSAPSFDLLIDGVTAGKVPEPENI